jgi:site-specific recombinase XerD
MDWRTDGPRIRRPVGTRNWQVAQRKAREWEAQGFISGGKTTTIEEATEKFIEDAKARNLREATLYKYDLLFRQLKAFADEYGLIFISDFTLDWTRKFRATWPNKNLAAKKKLEHLRAFFRFAYESNWMDSNPAAKLKPPVITESPTLPFSKEEMGRILNACNEYPDKRNAIRLRALVLLLRYSGLRFTDATKLSRDRITGDNLLL